MDGIEIQGLVKDYPRSNDLFQILCHPFRRERVRALAGIDLSMPRGGIYALLGPNGAGKTTLLKILGGLLLPDAGRVCIDGVDLTQKPDAIRQAVGFIEWLPRCRAGPACSALPGGRGDRGPGRDPVHAPVHRDAAEAGCGPRSAV